MGRESGLRNGLLTLSGMTRPELQGLIDSGLKMVERIQGGHRHGSELEGRVVTTAFFEPSTRTRLSFEQAARFLGADVMTFNPASSSTSKGESLQDTAETLAALGTDTFVVRHTDEEAPRQVADWTGLPVISGGAGRREHPTQALLDALTLTRHFGSVDGLKIAMVGDIRNSRVAASNLMSFPKLGARITLVGPRSLLPETAPEGVKMAREFDPVLGEVDVVYMLRIQRERGADTGLSDEEYVRRYGLDGARTAGLKPETVVMHPGPINRGVEITGDVADGPRSLILRQVANGVPMRMAVLLHALGVDI